jgi:hypothetical protein
MYEERFEGPYVHVTNNIHHEKMRMISINAATTNKKIVVFVPYIFGKT